jgi:hypothetical protein
MFGLGVARKYKMKVALITGGQPRFTKYWMENFKRIQGASKVDIYLSLWNNYIIEDSQLNFSDFGDNLRSNIQYCIFEKIQSVLTANVNLRRIEFIEEPSFDNIITDELIQNCIGYDELNSMDQVKNALKRIFSQRYSIYRAYQMLNDTYDYVIRFRLDGYPDRKINLDEHNLENSIVIPSNMRFGSLNALNESLKVVPFNDQFAIGNMQNMKTYCYMFNSMESNLREYAETIQPETGLCYHLVKNKIDISLSNINYYLINEYRHNGHAGAKMRKAH